MNMMRRQPGLFRQTNAFAMQSGLVLGVWMIATFALETGSARSEGLAVLFLLGAVGVPITGWQLVRHFRNRVCGGYITFARAYVFSLLLYFYAAVLLAAAVYVYFRFMDHGALMQSYIAYLDRPDVAEQLSSPAAQQALRSWPVHSVSQMQAMLGQMQSLNPTVWAANALNMTIFGGALCSLVVGLVTMRRPKF